MLQKPKRDSDDLVRRCVEQPKRSERQAAVDSDDFKGLPGYGVVEVHVLAIKKKGGNVSGRLDARLRAEEHRAPNVEFAQGKRFGFRRAQLKLDEVLPHEQLQ